jgi:hypothetical protein
MKLINLFVVFMAICMCVGNGVAEPLINIGNPMLPPAWAVLERTLIDENTEACRAFADHFLDSKGYLLHHATWGALAGTDDTIEAFRNWPVLHAIGGDDAVKDIYLLAYEGHLEQYKTVTTETTDVAADGCLYHEFIPMEDWLHLGEEMTVFNFQGLSAPYDRQYQRRIPRFAGLYLNEDPDAPNYDPEHNIIRSLWNGSKGPMLRTATAYDWIGDPETGRFHLLHEPGSPERMELFEDRYENMLDRFTAFCPVTAGDNPLNLQVTSHIANAYLLTHDKKYLDWVRTYIDGWKERTRENGGNIPGNIGLDGTIGGAADGKWYKGTYTWNFSYLKWDFVNHINQLRRSMWSGFGNAYLLTGDTSYLDSMRRQMNNIYDQRKTIDGELMVPYNYGDFTYFRHGEYVPIPEGRNMPVDYSEKAGWYNWRPKGRFDLNWLDLYLWSMDEKDLLYIEDNPWITFLKGGNPDYPVHAIGTDLTFIRTKIEAMRIEPTTPDSRLADWPMRFNPAATDALARLMMGGVFYPLQGLPHFRLRYFNPEDNTVGISPDVAALVTELSTETTSVTLVNTSQVHARTVTVQTGGYGEHECISVAVDGRDYDVNGRFFTVRLEPGAGSKLVIRHNLYRNTPTLAFPWHGEKVPVASL